jgi:hypothetical protein
VVIGVHPFPLIFTTPAIIFRTSGLRRPSVDNRLELAVHRSAAAPGF